MTAAEMVGALLVRDCTVLLGFRHSSRASYPGVWDMIGGHVEPGEDLSQAISRELYEELGIVAVVGQPLETLCDASLEMSLTVWRIDRWSGVVENRAPHEHSELRWFHIDEIDDLALPHRAYPELIAAALSWQR